MIARSRYADLPDHFYEIIHPTAVAKPELVLFNQKLASNLQLNFKDDKQIANYLSGNIFLPGLKHIALAYAGHQYGHFVPQLGDGRAVLLGEVSDQKGQFYEVQLKGSGKTRFSRGGDGRAALGPMIREYIVSEFMHAAGIASTRSLAVVKTGESVIREKSLPGAVLSRIAKSHVRVGSFEYFASRGDYGSVKILADYIIDRYHKELSQEDNRYQTLLANVIDKQASLIAQWLQIGFIHGVMNTDNTSILGETIDYGPCAFMDFYDPRAVYSSIDRHGRYAYNNQARIAEWNMAILVSCFLPLLAQNLDKAKIIGEELTASFMPAHQKYLQTGMCAKIGIKNSTTTDFKIVEKLLDLMAEFKVDFTHVFRYLGESLNNQSKYSKLLKEFFQQSERFDIWLKGWQIRLKQEDTNLAEIAKNMSLINPCVIPRNHLIEFAIRKAEEEDDISEVKNLITACASPFANEWQNSKYSLPPRPEEIVHATYCGT